MIVLLTAFIVTSGSPNTSTPGFLGPRAARSRAAWLTLLLVMALGLAADLVSKDLAFAKVGPEPVVLDRETLIRDREWSVPRHPPVTVLPGRLLDFHLVVNPGAVFGVGPHQRRFFVAFTVAALLTGLFIFGRTRSSHRMAHIAIGLVLAGGIGNLSDRVAFGVVRDFLHLLPGRSLPFDWRWPGGSPEMFPWVFNLADVFLLTGMALLLLHMRRLEKTAAGRAE